MEEFIYDADTNRHDQSSACLFIGQDSPSSINSGFLFVSVSSLGYELLGNWTMNIINFHQSRGITWQHDQGMFYSLLIDSITIS